MYRGVQGIRFDDVDTGETTPFRYVSDFRSRSAEDTKNLVDDEFSMADYADVAAAQAYMEEHDMQTVDFVLGEEQEYTARLHVPQEYSRIVQSMQNLYTVADDVDEPDFETVQIPHWDDGVFHAEPPENREAKILVDPDAGNTVVLGSDYTGEAKKSFLRNFMYAVKEELDGLGLHAGSKQVAYESGDGGEMKYQVFAGLSGTGKTTLSAIAPANGAAEVVQDDVIGLLPPDYDGDTVIGTERGMYAKTNGLTPEQESLYAAAQHPRTVQENVAEDGDFTDTELTVNGRAAIPRDLLDHAADTIDMPEIDEFFHITRNPLMPPVAKLTPDQSAAFFALGESVETGAGDEDSIGESIRVFGYNPFVIGSRRDEVERFRDLLEAHDADSYILNTGYVGDPENDVDVADTTTILHAVTRDDVDWKYDDDLGLQVPQEIDGVDLDALDPTDVVDNPDAFAELQDERQEVLREYNVPQSIRQSI